MNRMELKLFHTMKAHIFVWLSLEEIKHKYKIKFEQNKQPFIELWNVCFNYSYNFIYIFFNNNYDRCHNYDGSQQYIYFSFFLPGIMKGFITPKWYIVTFFC